MRVTAQSGWDSMECEISRWEGLLTNALVPAVAQLAVCLVCPKPRTNQKLNAEYAPVVSALGKPSQGDCHEFTATQRDPVSVGVVLNLQWREEVPSSQTFVSSVGSPISGGED